MTRLVWIALRIGLALGATTPALADDDRRQSRHERRHDRLESRHDDAHDRLEARHERAHERGLSRREHRRLHDRLEREHDRTHDRLERRHDAQHGVIFIDPRLYRYPRRYGDPGGHGLPRGGHFGSHRRRGDGWPQLGWIADDERLAAWVLGNFDYDRDGSLGSGEGEDARRELHRLADRDRDGRLTRRELDYWRTYTARY